MCAKDGGYDTVASRRSFEPCKCALRAMANGFCVAHKNGEVQSLEFARIGGCLRCVVRENGQVQLSEFSRI